MIRLHDTLTREKRPLVPLNPQRITMYVCGPTVYGRAHIGNARPAVVFDTLARLIRHEFGPDSLVYAATSPTSTTRSSIRRGKRVSTRR